MSTSSVSHRWSLAVHTGYAVVIMTGLVACSGDNDGGSSTGDGGATGGDGGATGGDGGGAAATYLLIDLDAGCSDGIIAELAFNEATLSGTFTPRACAPGGTPSGPVAAGSIEYHARFKQFMVADGHVLVEASESEAAAGLAPAAYCREADDETTIEVLRFALSTGTDESQCDIDHMYRDPVDFYYNSGGGGAPCSSMGYTRTANQIVFMDSDRVGADIALDMGSSTAGHPGVATLRLAHSSGDTITPSVLCWVNP